MLVFFIDLERVVGSTVLTDDEKMITGEIEIEDLLLLILRVRD